jgi:hypothetical protein
MTEQAISALRRRMIEDMSIRKFAAKTQLLRDNLDENGATIWMRRGGRAER